MSLASVLLPSDQGLIMGSTSGFAVPAPMLKRKTPSQLRQEQLKRNVKLKTVASGDRSSTLDHGPTTDLKKVPPRLIDTRVADIFAATKPHDRSKFLLTKQKDNTIVDAPAPNCNIRKPDVPKTAGISVGNGGESGRAAEILSKFRNVTEISNASDRAAPGGFNMEEALKLIAPISGNLQKADPGPAVGQLSLQEKDSWKSKTQPVDLSMKCSARFLSTNSLFWCHRTGFGAEVEGLASFVRRSSEQENGNPDENHEGCTNNQILDKCGTKFWQALFSWVHPSPQYSSLYDSVLAATRGETRKDAQSTVLYRMWEDSFASLYHSFRQKRCNQFYYCTQQFVVMFVGGGIAGREENSSNAYWSRSTRGTRRLLQEHGIEFKMPFSSPEAETTTMEDLQELTEFEQMHPGQTRQLDPSAVVDSKALSVLVFEGKYLHRLFDFLLNYRFIVGSTTTREIPTLYSPVEFKTATLYAPEVFCKRAECDLSSSSYLLNDTSGSNKRCTMYTMELRDDLGGYIPPWVIQRVCKVLQESQSNGFEASFQTGPFTEVLNLAQDMTSTETQGSAGNNQTSSNPGEFKSFIDVPPESHKFKMKVIKQLRYSHGFYELPSKLQETFR